MMNSPNAIVLAVHVVAATAAVALFWGAVLARKGGHRHLWAGRWYVRAMLVMTATAAILAVQLAADPSLVHPELKSAGMEHVQRARELGASLVGVSLLTAWLAWLGGRAGARRDLESARARRQDLAAAAGIALAGGAGCCLAIAPAFREVGDVGVPLLAVGLLHSWRILFAPPRARLQRHLLNILLSGAWLHAALAVQVAKHWMPGAEGVDVLLPGAPVLLLGIVVTIATTRFHRRRTAPGPGSRPRFLVESPS